MELPLTVSICALLVIIGLQAWYILKVTAENQRVREASHLQTVQYVEYMTKNAEKMTRDVPKMADKMLDSLTRSISDVTKGTSDAMQAIYGPVRVEEQRQTAEFDDLPTPWYTQEGAMDFTDPTDDLLVSDPVEYPEGGSNLIHDGDDEPFGIPGLKVGGD